MFPPTDVFQVVATEFCNFVGARWFALIVFMSLMWWAWLLRGRFAPVKDKYTAPSAPTPAVAFVRLSSDSLHRRACIILHMAIPTLTLGFVMFVAERALRTSLEKKDVALLGLTDNHVVIFVQFFVFVALIFAKFGSLLGATSALKNMRRANL
jgi:hypothetical protein